LAALQKEQREKQRKKDEIARKIKELADAKNLAQ
jgi:hypothetical protein